MSYEIQVAKDLYKFSAAHYTIFSKTKKESLHGHNYRVRLGLKNAQLDDFEMVAPFSEIKVHLKAACEELDEKTLIAKNSPYQKIEQNETSIELTFGTSHYQFPREEVVFIDCKNITSEALAKHLYHRLSRFLGSLGKIQVSISETPGQIVHYSEADY